MFKGRETEVAPITGLDVTKAPQLNDQCQSTISPGHSHAVLYFPLVLLLGGNYFHVVISLDKEGLPLLCPKLNSSEFLVCVSD